MLQAVGKPISWIVGDKKGWNGLIESAMVRTMRSLCIKSLRLAVRIARPCEGSILLKGGRKMAITKGRALVIMITLIGALALCGPAGAVVGVLDDNHDFARLADEGFLKTVNGGLNLVSNPNGSAANRYAWSMAWFQDRLYVGTVRSEGNDLRAQIFRYTPGGP